MRQHASRADLPAVTSGQEERERRGAVIRERFEALDIGDREWHRTTGIDRKTLNRAIRGKSTTTTYTAIESWLDKFEARAEGRPVAIPTGHIEDEHGGIVRIRLEGVFGAEAAIIEAPADNPDALAAALDLIMRRLPRDESSTTQEDETP